MAVNNLQGYTFDTMVAPGGGMLMKDWIGKYMAKKTPNYVPNYINYRGGSGGVLPSQIADMNAFARATTNEQRRAALTPEAQGIYTTQGAYMRSPSASSVGSGTTGGGAVSAPVRFGDNAYTGTDGGGYTGSNPKAKLHYNQGVPIDTIESLIGGGSTGGYYGADGLYHTYSGTNPALSGGGSGAAVTSGATSAAKKWASELADLWDTKNYGKDLYSEFNAPSWSDPAYRKEAATRRQYYSDITGDMMRSLAGQMSRASQIRGGYGVKGAGGPSDALLSMVKSLAGNRQDLISEIASGMSSEREDNRAAAMRGLESLLGARQGAYSGYTTATGNQASAIAQDAATELARQRLALDWYNATKNEPSSAQQYYQDQMAHLGYQAALQAQMDKEWAKQELLRMQSLMGQGALQGNAITDAARGQQFALQKQLEQALIAMGVASPVQRTQDMNEIMGYGSGGGPSGVFPSQETTGYGGQNIPQLYYNPYYWAGY